MAREGMSRELLCSDIDGFSLHAAVRVEAPDRKRLEQLCRTISRPALADERVQLNDAGQVDLKLKTPWRDGTTHLVMSPLEFMQRRSRDRPSWARTHQLGAAAQAGVRYRYAALPELRRRGARDHRRHPGAAGDREDPELPGLGPSAAAQGQVARGGAALRCLSRSRCRTPAATGCGYPAAAGGAARCVGKPCQHLGQP